jgi:hypothetical protein
MKLVGFLSWYDEEPQRLQKCIEDMCTLGVEDVVAVDGPYDLFPHGGKVESSAVEVLAIEQACWERDMGCLIYQPRAPWKDNEVGKRTVMMEMALALCDEGDWLLGWDADYHLMSGLDLRTCELPDRGVADVHFTDSPHPEGGSFYPVRLLIKARESIRYAGNHHTYLFPDGTTTQVIPRQGDWVWQTQVYVQHLPEARVQGRREKQVAYYEQRDSTGAES